MMMLLLAKIVKLSWLDDPSNKAVIDEVSKITQSENELQKLIGL